MCMLLFIRPLPFHMIQFLRICTIYIFTHLKISIFWTQQMWVSFRFWPNHWGQDSLVWKISCRRKISCLRRKCWIKNAPHQPLLIFINLPIIFCKGIFCKQGRDDPRWGWEWSQDQQSDPSVKDRQSQTRTRNVDPRKQRERSQERTRTILEDDEDKKQQS